MTSAAARTHPRELAVVLLAVAFAMVAATYHVARVGARWAEQDTAVLATALRAVHDTRTFAPTQLGYEYGYVYPSLSVVLLELTGVSVRELLLVVFPFLAAAVVPIFYVLFRELCPGRAAAIAVLALYLEPNFLFTLLRSNHEKFTLALAALVMLGFARGYHPPQGRAGYAPYAVLFAFAGLAMMCTNLLFATAFLGVTLGASVAIWVLTALGAEPARPLQGRAGRPLFVAAATLLLPLAFILAIYVPARFRLHVLVDVFDRLRTVVSEPSPTSNPYAYIATGWRSVWAYLGISLGSWLLAVSSLVVWLHQGWSWVVGRRAIDSRALVLWVVYGTFALTLGLAVAIDHVGFVGANAQLRLFPYFCLVAVPLVSVALLRGLESRRPGWSRRAAVTAAGLIVAWLSVASLLKATNEPWLSNNWLFHSAGEERALRWTERVARHRSIWTGFNDRLRSARAVLGIDRESGNRYDIARPKRATRTFLISDIIRAHGLRLGMTLPELDGADRIYDNGSTQIFHLRPVTPYQR